MKYVGSKRRIAKYILPIMLKNRKPNQYFVDAMCGGCNLIDKVDGNRIAADSNEYLIAFYKALQSDWQPPKNINVGLYNDVRVNKELYPKELVFYAGVCCSYNGKWFGGYAGTITTKINTIRNYQLEAYNNILKQQPLFKDIKFICCDYQDLIIPDNSIVYYDHLILILQNTKISLTIIDFMIIVELYLKNMKYIFQSIICHRTLKYFGKWKLVQV